MPGFVPDVLVGTRFHFKMEQSLNKEYDCLCRIRTSSGCSHRKVPVGVWGCWGRLAFGLAFRVTWELVRVHDFGIKMGSSNF